MTEEAGIQTLLTNLRKKLVKVQQSPNSTQSYYESRVLLLDLRSQHRKLQENSEKLRQQVMDQKQKIETLSMQYNSLQNEKNLLETQYNSLKEFVDTYQPENLKKISQELGIQIEKMPEQQINETLKKELKERQDLQKQLENLKKEKKQLKDKHNEKKNNLKTLPNLLQKIEQAAEPLQKIFKLKSSRDFSNNQLAKKLPPPLFTIYCSFYFLEKNFLQLKILESTELLNYKRSLDEQNTNFQQLNIIIEVECLFKRFEENEKILQIIDEMLEQLGNLFPLTMSFRYNKERISVGIQCQGLTGTLVNSSNTQALNNNINKNLLNNLFGNERWPDVLGGMQIPGFFVSTDQVLNSLIDRAINQSILQFQIEHLLQYKTLPNCISDIIKGNNNFNIFLSYEQFYFQVASIQQQEQSLIISFQAQNLPPLQATIYLTIQYPQVPSQIKLNTNQDQAWNEYALFLEDIENEINNHYKDFVETQYECLLLSFQYIYLTMCLQLFYEMQFQNLLKQSKFACCDQTIHYKGKFRKLPFRICFNETKNYISVNYR